MTPIVNGALVDNGDGTVTDTDLGIMWLKDANYAFTSGYDDDGLMTWDEALTWAEGLDFAGYSDWRLPDAHDMGSSYICVGYDCTLSEMGHLYYIELGNSPGGPLTNTGPFENVQDYYWSETERWELTSQAWDFDFSTGHQYIWFKAYSDDYAWPLRTFPVMIAYKPGYYPSVQAGYDAAVEGDIIMSQGIVFDEDLIIDDISNKTVSFACGYNYDFKEITGVTTIYGDMVVSSGKLIIEFGVLEVF